MKIHEKIRFIRKKLGLTIKDVYDLQLQDFGPNEAISIRTLHRIEDGQIAKFSHILKICQTLGITLVDLLKDTELADHMLIKSHQRIDSYTYNEKAYASVVSSPSANFLTLELTLLPGGKTLKEQSPNDGKKYEKHIYVLEGKFFCVIGNNAYEMKRKDALSFDSTQPHWYENRSQAKAVCLITQIPKYY